jgi:hydroxyacylglutathione hydrolase
LHAKPAPLTTEITTVPINEDVSVTIVPALTDNYIFVLRDEKNKLTYVIDPSVADPVLDLCKTKRWALSGVLLTHHHGDHVDGAIELAKKFTCPIYGNAKDQYRLPQITKNLTPDGEMDLEGLRVRFFATPGHTSGHMCYFFPTLLVLFCGDTLFSFGCGRLFEGTAEQMVHSLQKIRSLPTETLIFFAHEYTKKNLAFALTIEPESEDLQKKYLQAQTLRGQHKPTVPTPLKDEMALSPFLRWDSKALRHALEIPNASDVEVFSEVRERRNHF